LLAENNKFEDVGLIEMTQKIEIADGKSIFVLFSAIFFHKQIVLLIVISMLKKLA
jgi:hypothetical protein